MTTISRYKQWLINQRSVINSNQRLLFQWFYSFNNQWFANQQLHNQWSNNQRLHNQWFYFQWLSGVFTNAFNQRFHNQRFITNDFTQPMIYIPHFLIFRPVVRITTSCKKPLKIVGFETVGFKIIGFFNTQPTILYDIQRFIVASNVLFP